jgi:hypothetical protein
VNITIADDSQPQKSGTCSDESPHFRMWHEADVQHLNMAHPLHAKKRTLLEIAGIAWILGFAMFLIEYAPMLLGPRLVRG